MARGFPDLVTATFGAGREATQRCTLFDVDGRNLQFVDIGTVIVLSIGNRRLQNPFRMKLYYYIK